MWDAVFLHQTIGLGFLGATAWVLIDRWQAWAETRRAARDLEPIGAGASFVDPRPASQHTDTQSVLRMVGISLGLGYVLGYWIYGVWYVWEHWSGYSGFDILYGFMRAIIWPVWLALALM